MSRLAWTLEKVRTGPESEESLPRAAVAFWVYWRTWATMTILWAGVALTGHLFGVEAAFGGWIIGLFTGQVASEVWD